MNVLVIGSGGREHALVWKIAQSPLVKKVYCAPGNAGMEGVAKLVPIGADELGNLLLFADENDIDLTVVGPEAPLVAGLVDAFENAGLMVVGPRKAAAMLEGSKVFMKGVLTRAGVPTARYEVHTSRSEAVAALQRFGAAVVIKADGLAAGKGVVVAKSRDEAVTAIDDMVVKKVFGPAGEKIILEETLIGEEASILAFCDGKNVIMMPSSQDHKRIGDGDTGPNTGGMGAYSPAPVITPELSDWIEKNVMLETLSTMAGEGNPYKGILYAGIMITAEGPKVLEFNCRFGDPECQPLMRRMKSDIVPVLFSIAEGDLSNTQVEWTEEPAVGVVMASKGYPGDYEKGKPISGLEEANGSPGAVVFHSGTKKGPAGEIVTNGGRVLCVTATGVTVGQAINRAYEAAGKIKFEGAVYRKDIGRRALER
ncbi:MAG: phosphoribosylamine--glycine ligase [Nitrospinae bacterium]|nr:phosphoribosylamine--glycine ligase [Nitrospinota bacterium]